MPFVTYDSIEPLGRPKCCDIRVVLILCTGTPTARTFLLILIILVLLLRSRRVSRAVCYPLQVTLRTLKTPVRLPTLLWTMLKLALLLLAANSLLPTI